MGSNIIERENENSSIEKLAAQSALYTRAKVFFYLQAIISVLFVVLLSFLQHFVKTNEFSLVIAFYSLLAMILDFVLEKNISSVKEKAAKIQEKFDTYVLNIPWNHILVGAKPEHGEILLYYKKYTKNKTTEKLFNWYSVDITKLSGNIAKLICQKSNCNYDISIRKHFNLIIYIISSVSFLCIVINSLISGITVANLFLITLAPLAPLFQWAYKHIDNNRNSISKIATLTTIIDSSWEDVKKSKVIADSTIRYIQDSIYLNRTANPLMPDFLYNILRPRNEATMNYTVQELVREYENK